MTHEIKIEKKASEVIQPNSAEEAREAIRTKKDLSGADLRNIDLSHLTSVGAILRKADMSGANLAYARLTTPNFYRTNLFSAALHNITFIGGDLVRTSFLEADLHHARLFGINAQEASFAGTDLRNAALVSANLQDADFTDADLTNAKFITSDVTGADFTGAQLTGARAYKVDWFQAKVPPTPIPEPMIELPTWTWSVIIGAVLGSISLGIYALIRKQKSQE